MYHYAPGHSRIVATGAFLPAQRVRSEELMREIDSLNRFGIPYDWLQTKMGIEERRVADDGDLPSDMAARAAREALERAGLDPRQIDVIIYAGIDRDYVEPATAHVVQDKIGAANAYCVDVSNACHGFMNGVHLMDALITSGQVRYGLICSGEQPSRIARHTVERLKRATTREEFYELVGGLTTGDAGAAMIVAPKREPAAGFAGFMLQSDGRHSDLCVYTNRDGRPEGHMHMRDIVRAFVDMHARMFDACLRELGWRREDIRLFVHHQVGIRVFHKHARYARLPVEIMPNTLSSLGNITSATIPVNLHRLVEAGALQDQDKIFLSGTGSGLTISQSGLVWEAA